MKLLPSSHFLRIGSFLRQLLFGTPNFLLEELFKIKVFTEKLLFQSRYFCAPSPYPHHRGTFWKMLIFHKSIILQHLLFLESYFFIVATFSKDLTFHSSYFSRKASSSQHTFSEEILFHSYAFFPHLLLRFFSW